MDVEPTAPSTRMHRPGESSEPLVDVQDIHVAYGPAKIIHGVSFALRPREILCIIGGSGSGKSTILRSCIGAVAPWSGDVRIEGKSVHRGSRAEQAAVRRRFGVLFQSGALIGSLSVGDNVAMPLRQHTKLDESTIRIVVQLKLGQVGLSDTQDLFPSQLSGGMRKRAGLARALALDPPLVFCDEPSAGLDPISVGAIDQLLLDLRAALGLGALVVTHELPSVMRIADRIVMLHGGVLIFDGTREEFQSTDEPHVVQFRSGSPDGPIGAAGNSDLGKELVQQ
jgi:phospholipid/cholesterol/gamma-HCH transport system ATP-binding protein